jgi:hypothetical protein
LIEIHDCSFNCNWFTWKFIKKNSVYCIWTLLTNVNVCLMVFNATFNNISVVLWKNCNIFVACLVHVHLYFKQLSREMEGPLWPWSYGSWIYNYLCNQYLSPLMLWVRISIKARCTTLCDKVCQWLGTDQWFSPSPPVSSSNKTDRHNITEILLKVSLSIINIKGKTNNNSICISVKN